MLHKLMDASLQREQRLMRRELEQARLNGQFWALWDVSMGPRKEILLIFFGAMLPAFIFGASEPAFSPQNVLAVAAGMILMWTATGLLPDYSVRSHLVERPELVLAFMRKHGHLKESNQLRKLLYGFLRTKAKNKKERGSLETLIGFNRFFMLGYRHGFWALPVLLVCSLALSYAAIWGLQRLF